MTEATELFKNFQHLWQAGKDARLNLECHAGQVWLHLQVQLHHPPSPQQYHPHPPRQGPSRLRRRARRAEERAKAAANVAPSKSIAEVFAQTDEIQTVDAAVQAAIPTPIAVDAAVQAVEKLLIELYKLTLFHTKKVDHHMVCLSLLNKKDNPFEQIFLHTIALMI